MLQRATEIVFATDFSDSSHAIIPTIAQWVENLGAKLTLLHIYNPKKMLYREAEARLQSFFAEADNYRHCDRVLVSGDPCDGIASYCESRSNVLLMLPPSDLSGLPRPWHRSMRARLIRRLTIPIWTVGKVNVGEPAPISNRNIGVWLGDPEEGISHLQHAAAYASETGGTLHLLHVVDEIDEGSMLKPLLSSAPMGLEAADRWARDLAGTLELDCSFEVHVAQGRIAREFPQLLHRSGANMLVLSQQSAVHRAVVGLEINPVFRNCPISLVCVPFGARMEDLHRQVAESAA
ncbi:universal stress protein [Edaphobacter sp. 12200R-103]|uniref:universal stress protein n=1 Tax=Edaphobacter sp. 12200R-103 TaxID=2703788 RepID=UPI00138C6A96|nr:universal stress protein [Edaphobacter sp. 12200R-103]QHS53423.1 universal stress protein [Edaphobacter sp. 12200R-103]